MLVTDRHRKPRRDLVASVLEAVRGGVRMIELREKDLSDDEMRDLLGKILAGVPSDTRVLVNGRPALAREAQVGLHLPANVPFPGREGLSLWGRSAHDEAEVRAARGEGASYVILGSLFATPSKPGSPGQGVDLVRRLGKLASPLPVYAIGGITVSHVPEVIHAGAHGVAVCGAILSASDPRRAAEAFGLALSVAGGGRA